MFICIFICETFFFSGKAANDIDNFEDGTPIDLDSSNNFPDDVPPVFIAFENCDSGFVWLKLQEEYFYHWEDLCLQRQVDKPSCFLSSKLLTNYVKNVILSSSDLKNVASKKLNLNPTVIQLDAECHGPAFTIKVSEVDISNRKHIEKNNLILFETNFTLALHCPYWPKDANGICFYTAKPYLLY